ncbi:MAG TPA: tetratricopeptide repeat protein [Pyrinomonadaceae bacterium]|nr:tetratricopeptide repeat protein [Pyrinomonadaceae bacterium]
MNTRSNCRPILFLLTIIFLLACSTHGISQIAGGMTETTRTDFGGNSFISGSVFFPSGAPINFRIRIRLSSITGGEIFSNSDDSGKFVFSRLSRGTYTLTIDGEQDFEPTSQVVDILQNRDVQNVSFRLTAKSKISKKPELINAEIAAAPKKALEFYQNALKLAAAGDGKGAIELLKLAVAEYPDFSFAYTEMGVQYLRLNELNKADEALLAALKIKPAAYEPLLMRGIVMFRANRFADAATMLRGALKAKDQSAIAHFYLGRTFMSQKKYDEAEKEFNLSLTIGGEQMKEAHRMLANMYLSREDYKRTLTELEIYLKLAPTAPDAEQLRDVVSQLKTLVQKKP